jgi:hypothetical protein
MRHDLGQGEGDFDETAGGFILHINPRQYSILVGER